MAVVDAPQNTTISQGNTIGGEFSVNPSKRKRSQSPVKLNGQPSPPSSLDIPSTIRDIWAVLQTNDTTPSILALLTTSDTSNDAAEAQRHPKRPRVSPIAEPLPIASQVLHNGYASIEQFAQAVGSALNEGISLLQSPGNTTTKASAWKSLENVLGHERLQTVTTTLSNLAATLCLRETTRIALLSAESSTGAKEQAEISTQSNGRKEEAEMESISLTRDSRTVLTLFGNASGHKQLFSSLQKSTVGGGIKTLQVIPENALPIGISTTKVVQTGPGVTKKRPSTFLDLFAPPALVPPIQAPKTPKAPANRTAITWSKVSPAEEPALRGYVNEKLPTGQWLGYGGIAVAEEPTSPEARRRQRDRTLSMSIPEPGQTSKSTAREQTQEKEDALFRAAYSTFAPSKDNSGAIVSEQLRNDIWWDRYGNDFFAHAFGPRETTSLGLLDAVTDTTQDKISAADNDEEFRIAVEEFVPDTDDPFDIGNSGEADAENLLQEISNTIQALYLHQRIRMASLTPATRPTLAYTSLPQDAPAPSVPSAAEIETYKTLKAHLALIISTLPPYVVAKLNGDQLDELNISRQVPIEMPDYRGVMEEDAASRLAKSQAFQAAVGQGQTSRPNAVSTPNTARATQVQPARNLAQASQTIPRPSTFTRQPLSSWQTPSTNAATVQRPAYASQQNLSQQRQGMLVPMPNAGRSNYSQSTPRPYQSNGSYGTPNLGTFQRPGQTYNAAAAYGSPQPSAYRSAPSIQPYVQQQMYQQGQSIQQHPSMGAVASQSPPRPTAVLQNGTNRPETPASPANGHPHVPLLRMASSGFTPTPGPPTPNGKLSSTSVTPQPGMGTPKMNAVSKPAI